jgi:hypothetical protein
MEQRQVFSSEVTVVGPSRPVEERLPADIRARYGTHGLPERALCRIVDITKRGAKLEVYCDLPPSTMIALKLPNADTVRARVIWSNDFEAGCQFLEPLSDLEFDTIYQNGHA